MPSEITAYGIDLGTTNSTLAVVRSGADSGALPAAEVVEIEQRRLRGPNLSAIVPSFVAIYEGDEWVGEGARDLRGLPNAADKGIRRNQTLFYECKNEIGTSRTYSRDGPIRTPVDVAERILRFIRQQGIGAGQVENVVVTVPASFQVRQRQDTMEACRRAGLNVSGHRLLDEPCAAFIDYAARFDTSLMQPDSLPKRLLVFDFGGGTCDVALFEIARPVSGPIAMKSLSVSRYHRLGGGDIDLAIVHRVLLPALREENGLSPFEPDFDELQAVIVPALLPAAEALKIQLTNEIWRLREFNQYEARRAGLTARFAAAVRVRAPRLRRELTLSPSRMVLSAQRFDDILEPFLTTEILVPQMHEGRIECSIFAPIEDALTRSNLSRNDLDYVFAVGGSALISQVVDALRAYFPQAQLLTYPNRNEFQYSIARGAALQAWSLATSGRGLVQPVAQDDLYLALDRGELRLVERGAALPFPAEGEQVIDRLGVPEDAITRSVPIAVRILAGSERRVVGGGRLDVAGVSKHAPIELRYRFDENQVLTAMVRLRDVHEGSHLRLEIENPVSNVVNPNAKVERREQLLDKLRRDESRWRDLLPELAEVCAELGHHGEAIAHLKRYELRLGVESPWSLNRRAMFEEGRHNHAVAKLLYEHAARLPNGGGAPCFNLALFHLRSDAPGEGLRWIDEAIRRTPQPAYEVLRLRLLQKTGADTDIAAEAGRVLARFGRLTDLNDFELGWYQVAARLAGDDDALRAAEAQERARRREVSAMKAADGLAPVLIERE
ncbi:MAG: molecular chaperone DnaK [Betaproteobacteria bacterium]